MHVGVISMENTFYITYYLLDELCVIAVLLLKVRVSFFGECLQVSGEDVYAGGYCLWLGRIRMVGMRMGIGF